MMIEKKGKIKSLQALRACAFFSIFLTHYFSKMFYTYLSLSIFFVLSGFLLSIKYENYDKEVNIKNSFKFALDRIKRLYPLHIITMIMDIVLYIEMFKYNGINIKQFFVFIFKIFANIFLIQSWIPVSEIVVSLNGVAWFLSILFFLYISFPFINKKLKNKDCKFYIFIFFILLLIKLLFIFIFRELFGVGYHYEWFKYHNAFIRLFDFICGYCIGRIYCLKSDDNISSIFYTLFEILSTVFCIFLFGGEEPIAISTPILRGCINCCYTILSCFWVYLFAINKGMISRVLSNKIFVKIGNVSGYAFLIHYPVIQYTNFFLSIIPYSPTNKAKAILFLLDFVITIVLSYLWHLFSVKKNKREAYD